MGTIIKFFNISNIWRLPELLLHPASFSIWIKLGECRGGISPSEKYWCFRLSMCRLSAEEYYPGKYCEPGIILKGILYVVSSMRWSLAPVLDCLFIPRQPPAPASAAGRLQPDTELWINPCSFEVGLSIKHELLMLWFDVLNWYVPVQTDLHAFSTSAQKQTTDNCKCLLEKANSVANYHGHFFNNSHRSKVWRF